MQQLLKLQQKLSKIAATFKIAACPLWAAVIRSMLLDAGIDVSIFSAHSSHTASTSYSANAQLPLADILKAAGWSNARTFAEHYNKPISGNLGQTLLTHFDSAAQAN